MAQHTKGARPSTWDKHTDRDKGYEKKIKDNPDWIDQGKRTNSSGNQLCQRIRAGSGLTTIFDGWREAGYAELFYDVEYGPDRTILTLPLVSESARKWPKPPERPPVLKPFSKCAKDIRVP